jgi:hypothetical protein
LREIETTSMGFNLMCCLWVLLMAKWGKYTKVGRAILQNKKKEGLIVAKPSN